MMATQVAYSPQAVAPPAQQMTDVLQILAPQKGILMAQRLDLLEALVGWEQRNKYGVSTLPAEGGDPALWEDRTFMKNLKKGHLLSLKEESDCCQRQMCRPRHSLTIKVKGGDATTADGVSLAEFDRPFKCTLNCCCCLFNPQVLTVTIKGQETGRVVQHYPCSTAFFCCKRYWKVLDAQGKETYLIRDDFCCNGNMCAPSCCCRVRTIDILTPDETTKVGSVLNIFPGCNFKGCFGSFDNYALIFPETASPTDKLNLLGALALIEYMVFEKKPDNSGSGLSLDI